MGLINLPDQVPATIRIAAYTGTEATITAAQATDLLSLVGRLVSERDTAREATRRPLHRERVW